MILQELIGLSQRLACGQGSRTCGWGSDSKSPWAD